MDHPTSSGAIPNAKQIEWRKGVVYKAGTGNFPYLSSKRVSVWRRALDENRRL